MMKQQDILRLIEKHADNMRIVWDNDLMEPVRELVYIGGFDCWQTRWIEGFKDIITTDNFHKAFEKLINP